MKARLMVFLRMVRSWLVRLRTLMGIGVLFAGHRQEGCKTSEHLGGDESTAYGVSADGSVVVGAAENADGHWRAFRWTQAGGMQDLGTLGGDESTANSVSADGSVVVGMATKKVEGFIGGRYERRYVRFEVARIFRWTQASGMKELSDYLYRPQVTAISPDGRYIAGYGYKSLWFEPRKAFLLVTRE
jgi:probable HAF family extracellular repeat protein